MAIPGTAFPGTALIGQASPGYLGPPAGIPGHGIIVGTTPVLLASSATAADMLLPSGECYITNGDQTIYLGGGPNVTPGNGFPVLDTASVPVIHLFPADQIWACTASGTSTVYVTQTGG